jgi:hypothetical protein
MTTIACTTCNARTQLLVDARHDVVPEEDGPKRFYELGHCAACSNPGIVQNDQGNYGIWEEAQVFPVMSRGLEGPLPKLVEVSYREAVKCSSAEAWLATVVMVRRTLEAIGKEFKPEAKRLFDGLKAMKEKGIISDELLEWGHQLRFLGNIGAHPTEEEVSPEDGRDAMEFLEAIAETIYHLRPKFEAMRARRAKKEASSASSESSDE